MEEKGQENASDKIMPTRSCECVGKNIIKLCEKVCTESLDYNCLTCTEAQLTKGHNLRDNPALQTSTQTSASYHLTEKCPVHRSNVLEVYCKNHDQVVCKTCAALHHRTCEDLYSIPDEADYLYTETGPAEAIKKLADAKRVVKDIKKDKEHLLNELLNQRQDASHSIKAFRKELEEEIKGLEAEAKDEIDECFDRIETGLKNEIQEIEKHTANLDEYANKLLQSRGNKAQEFICIKTSAKEIKQVTKATQFLERKPELKVNFVPDSKIQNILKGFRALGKVSLTKRSHEQRSSVYTVQQEKDIPVKLKDDKSECCIYGSCFLTDGTLLLADLYNNRLKRLHLSADTIRDYLDLEAGPIAVCQIRQHEAALTLANKSIQFVLVADKMTTSKKLQLDHHCCGLAYNDGKLFVSDESKALYIHDMSGTILYKITSDKSGNSLLSCSKHISLCTNRERVYVTDRNNGLISFDTQGNHHTIFTDPDLVQPFGVCTDWKGSVFVCGWGSSNIVQISERLQTKVGVIKTVPNPLSVCFDPNQKKLIVTNWKNNTIKVYELQ